MIMAVYSGTRVDYVPGVVELSEEEAQKRLIDYVAHVLLDEVALRYGPSKESHG